MTRACRKYVSKAIDYRFARPNVENVRNKLAITPSIFNVKNS